jgi:GNAT superfamily N-acetyltransferase
MFEIHVVDSDQYDQPVREIFWEYLQWVNDQISREYGVSFDIAAILDRDMLDLGKFMPPSGRLLLGTVNYQTAGIACLKSLTDDCGEIKRMYVRPDARKIGLGGALLERILAEAAKIGYSRIRLDSARFMGDAHRLYRKLGFQEIEPYEGSEIPLSFQSNWVFMEKDIDFKSGAG